MKARILSRFILLAVLAGGVKPAQGDWTFMPPAPPPVGEASFAAVDGAAPDDVWAVGVYQPAVYRILIEHFDGVAWTQVPVPTFGYSDVVSDVLAVSGDRALAVGQFDSGPQPQPLVLEWNGIEWLQVPGPETPSGELVAVDQTPAGDIWVAGHRLSSPSPSVSFLARKGDEGWTFANPPPVPCGFIYIHKIHAATNQQIWVAGSCRDLRGGFQISISRFDVGSGWTVFDVTSPGLQDNLEDILAFAPNDVWAVGKYYHPQLYHDQPLIMHYDGGSWTQVQLPAYPAESVILETIAARSPSDIYASGTSCAGSPVCVNRPFMLHYDGREPCARSRHAATFDRAAECHRMDRLGHGGIQIGRRGARP